PASAFPEKNARLRAGARPVIQPVQFESTDPVCSASALFVLTRKNAVDASPLSPGLLPRAGPIRITTSPATSPRQRRGPGPGRENTRPAVNLAAATRRALNRSLVRFAADQFLNIAAALSTLVLIHRHSRAPEAKSRGGSVPSCPKFR